MEWQEDPGAPSLKELPCWLEETNKSTPANKCLTVPVPALKKRHAGQGRCREKTAFAFGLYDAVSRGGCSEIVGKALPGQTHNTANVSKRRREVSVMEQGEWPSPVHLPWCLLNHCWWWW